MRWLIEQRRKRLTCGNPLTNNRSPGLSPDGRVDSPSSMANRSGLWSSCDRILDLAATSVGSLLVRRRSVFWVADGQ